MRIPLSHPTASNEEIYAWAREFAAAHPQRADDPGEEWWIDLVVAASEQFDMLDADTWGLLDFLGTERSPSESLH